MKATTSACQYLHKSLGFCIVVGGIIQAVHQGYIGKNAPQNGSFHMPNPPCPTKSGRHKWCIVVHFECLFQ